MKNVVQDLSAMALYVDNRVVEGVQHGFLIIVNRQTEPLISVYRTGLHRIVAKFGAKPTLATA